MIPKSIESIRFRLMSPDEIRNLSVTKVITPDTIGEDGFPITMGLMDTRLGVIEPGLVCRTCGKRVDECPGHFGHVELERPVVHVGYAKLVKNWLNATCSNCGRITLSDEKREKYLNDLVRVKEEGSDTDRVIDRLIKEASMATVCPHCGADSPKVNLDKPTTFRIENSKLTPTDVRTWLEKISDEDCELLGIGYGIRPEWAVLAVLPVPPVTVRPSITLETGERSEDDLTHKLVDILRINQRLRENIDAGAPQLIVEDLWELLQYHVTTYFDNQTSGIPPARHRSGRPLRTLAQRLKGKEGRFRSNLSGKRVNFSARTVISPDPMISLNEVGVPLDAAKELTVPERATEFNIEGLRNLVRNGPDVYPGANYVIKKNKLRLRVTDVNRDDLAESIEPGDVVERQLIDGDAILFNRQPSLHRMSMLCHRAKILPYHTFRLNPLVCSPYNADFDGDEMNLHVLQSEEAIAEARSLMSVEAHLLSPRFGGAIIGCIHDHITGLYYLTHGFNEFEKSVALRMLSGAGIDKVPEKLTGKEIFSLILPQIDMEFKAKICEHCEKCDKENCPDDAYVVIRNGKLIKGTIDDVAVGAFNGKVINEIAKEYGDIAAKDFLDAASKLSLSMLSAMGFTVGIDEEDIPLEAQEQIQEILDGAKERVDELIEIYERGELEQAPGRSLEETLELEIMRILAKARDDCGQIASKHVSGENSAVIMAKIGARGSMLNISQMSGSVGPQSIRGERISRGYEHRTLSHFKKGDIGAEARGFVESSYKKGLKPLEYFFHSMAGREGLVDTAVRTSRSGYMQRRLINALENLKVDYDETVRDPADKVIQFLYGDDGVDPSKSIEGEAVDVDSIVNKVLRGE
ncbi:MAG: DNA-directed RNA polymerase subunit A' [Candidatus Thermoplasmatota archaeon]|nr:DNA-directed RNA polymerase subunit A' [Candidatus Thermoplasmatota archaeon]